MRLPPLGLGVVKPLIVAADPIARMPEITAAAQRPSSTLGNVRASSSDRRVRREGGCQLAVGERPENPALLGSSSRLKRPSARARPRRFREGDIPTGDDISPASGSPGVLGSVPRRRRLARQLLSPCGTPGGEVDDRHHNPVIEENHMTTRRRP